MNTVTCKITDAVNEFKAEWERGRALIYKVKVTGDLNFSNFIPLANQDSWGYACNKDEFEARVFYMTLNFGESSLKRLRIWQEGIKRQPESDEQHTDKLNEMNKELGVMDMWKYAPEDATHYSPNDSAGVLLYYKPKGKGYVYFHNGAWELSHTIKEYLDEILIERPKPVQPVFTQAMADNGELPKAGMLCLINFPDIDNAWYEYTIDFIGKHMVVATCKEVAERTGHIDNVYFKPIDTRTDKEKAIDDMVEHLTNEGIVTYDNIMLKILVEKFIGSKIHCVKWVGE